MGFALDEFRRPCMSVEAAALFQLVQQEKNETTFPVPAWLTKLKTNWTQHMSFFIFNNKNGWRGCFAEHRLWSSLIMINKNNEKGDLNLKTPYAIPTIRSWFHIDVLNDFIQCVGNETASKIANVVAEMGYDGSPDLVLYNETSPIIWFVEVKSATDRLKENQIKMMQKLSELSNVVCQICCPRSAVKRFSKVSFSNNSESDSS